MVVGAADVVVFDPADDVVGVPTFAVVVGWLCRGVGGVVVVLPW